MENQWRVEGLREVPLSYFPQTDIFLFFSFSFSFFFTETRNSQMQVKKQKIFYNIKKSSVVGVGMLLRSWARLDSMAFVGCMDRMFNMREVRPCQEVHEHLLLLITVRDSVYISCEGLQREAMEAHLNERSSQLKRGKKLQERKSGHYI